MDTPIASYHGVTFGSLPVGARFSFPPGSANRRLFVVAVFTKTSHQWFTDGLRKFHGGQHTAVVEVKS